MKKFFSMLLAMALLLTALPLAMAADLTDEEMAAIETQSQKKKANVIITNDGECDDMDSMLRYLNYANEFNTKAIIICSSSYHWTGGTIIDPATHEPAKYDPDVHGPTEPYETEQRGKTVTVTPDVTPFEYTSPTTGETYLALHYKQSRWTGLNWYNAFLNGYEESYENLSSYDDSYPTPEYLECCRDYQYFYLNQEKEPLKCRLGMNQLETVLAEEGFIRIHQGYIVNYIFIKRIDNEYIELTDGHKLPISRRKKQSVLTQYMRLSRSDQSIIFAKQE